MSVIFPIQQDGRLGRVSGRDLEHVDGALADSTVEAQFGSRGYLGPTGVQLGRLKLMAGFCVIACVLFIGRAAQLQMWQGGDYRALAEQNRFRSEALPATRGIVYDRNGTPLIENISTFTLTMTVGDLPAPYRTDEREKVLNRAAELAGVHRADLDFLITEHATNPFEPVPVKRGLDYESALRLAIATSDLPGFALQTSSTRRYNTSSATLSHVLGYVGNVSAEEYQSLRSVGYRMTDQIGKNGIEKSAETLLRGTNGTLRTEVDSLGNEIGLISREEPVDGANLTLSIDLGLQQLLEQQVGLAAETVGSGKGAAVALDPNTGSVLALVSWPSYDSNAFADGIEPELYQALIEDERHPLFARAIAGEYPSGSTFKPFVSYAALAEGIVDEHTSFVSTGGISVGGSFFPDWRAGGHGITDVRKAIADSVNTYYYIIGGGFQNFTGLGVERITDYARDFGFGSPSGIDLPSEADGFLPSKEWKQEVKGERWYVGDTYHLAIGQGDLLVTPLQIAAATAVIANGGSRVTPHLVDGVDGAPASIPTTEAASENFEQDAIQIVREGMRQGVVSGSSRFLSSLSTPVAGKTGTAQPGGDQPTHAWFIGFGPYENPSIVLAILIENGGEGSSVAVPIAKEAFAWWFTQHPTP